MKILESATKITLLTMVVALIGLTSFQLIDPKIFEDAMIMVMAFYFGQKVNIK